MTLKRDPQNKQAAENFWRIIPNNIHPWQNFDKESAKKANFGRILVRDPDRKNLAQKNFGEETSRAASSKWIFPR